MERPQSLVFQYSEGKACEQNPGYEFNAFRKEYYFFYGTLMDRFTLATVLQQPSRLQLYPAEIVGFSCKLWGPYPAVVDGPTGAIVHGMAYEVQSVEEADLLQAYETDNYAPRGCVIKLEDGREVGGKVFKWRADKALLKEGSFDLKDFQMRNLEES